MGAGDNSTVKIVIDVVDANSGKVLGLTYRNIESLGTAAKTSLSPMQRLAASIRDVKKVSEEAGTAGAAVGPKVGAGMKEAGAHTLTNLDYVRQLRDDLGIRIPRSMEKFISQSALASKAIGAIGTGLIGLGGVEIFAHMAEGAYQLYKRLGDVNSAMSKYAQESAKASQQKLFDNGSIESQRALVKQLDTDIAGLEEKRRIAGVGKDGSGGFAQRLNPILDQSVERYTKHDDERNAELNARRDAAKEREAQLKRESELQATIDAGAVKAADQVGKAARQTKLETEDAAAALKYLQTQGRENELYQQSLAAREEARRSKKGYIPDVYKPDPNAGREDYVEAVAKNHGAAAADDSAEGRKQREETLHMQAEANAAQLRGEDKFAAEEAEKQRQLTALYRQKQIDLQNYIQRSESMEKQYQADKKKRLEEENAENARLQAESAQGGEKGLGSSFARERTELAGLDKEAPDFKNPQSKAIREAAIRAKTNAEVQEQQDRFSERLQDMEATRTNSTMSANQKIDASTKKTQQELQRSWDDLYGHLNEADKVRVKNFTAIQKQTQDAIAAVGADGEKEKAQARQTLTDETYKMEAEAGRRGMTREQEAQHAILDEYNQRYRQLEELRTKDADNADLYRRQEIAAEQIKNGKLIEEQRQMRDKLAGTLRGFMNNPIDAAKRLGEDAASKFGASLLLKATGGGAAGAGGPMQHIGGVFDGLGLGHQHGGGGQHTQATISSVTSPSATMKADSAVINITGSATVNGVQGAAGPAAAAGSGGTFDYAGMGHGGGSFSTTSGSWGDNLGTTGTAGASGPVSGGFTSTGGPAVAASMASLGIQDAGTAPKIASGVEGGFGMATDVAALGKSLSKDGSGASKLFGKAGTGLAKAAPALGAAAGLFGAFESNGGVGGALSGALSGAQLGSMIGGPIGAAVGAVAGGIMGALGFGGAGKAAEYDRKEVRPRLAADLLGFETGTAPYQTAYEDMNKLDSEARKQTKQWGPGGSRQYNNHIKGEIKAAMDRLTQEQKSGRSKYGMSAAQFHGGGLVQGFGDFSTGPNSGFAHLEMGETVMHQQATQTHGDALAMMLGGATRAQMAGYYGGTTAPAAGGGDVNLNFHSHDAKGAMQLFMDNAHTIRRALNSTYAENSGGSDA